MKILMDQLRFDARRLIIRNAAFQFFALVMPAAFYLLFTKVMVTGGTTAQIALFNRSYMGSMIVYSGTISTLFSIAQILMHDRERGLLRWLRLTPHGVVPYYRSIGMMSLGMNALTVVILGALAVVVNHVDLTVVQWLGILGIALIGQLPTLLMGVGLSFLNRAETLSVASNLITFPMAIISGLWWPISLLPSWLQVIGKRLPTYYVNDLLVNWGTHGTLKLIDLLGIGLWVCGLLVIVSWVIQRVLKRGNGVVDAS